MTESEHDELLQIILDYKTPEYLREMAKNKLHRLQREEIQEIMAKRARLEVLRILAPWIGLVVVTTIISLFFL